MNKAVIEEIKEKEWGKVEENVLLKDLTTYKVGGRADLVISPKTSKDLIELRNFLRHHEIPYKVLGNGSNVLFSDRPFQGVIIKLDYFNKMEIKDNKVTVGAGYPLVKLAYQTIKKGLSGLEFASGIPGSVGGAVYMNAGAYKSDMGYIVQKCKVLTKDDRVITLTNKELNFHYRTSFLSQNKDYICLEATLRLKKGKVKELEEIVRDRKKRRLASQPLEYPSAGSVFRNPEGMYAGQLIEELGLKGLRRGGAKISEKHANFIVNDQNAKARDIKDLIDLVKEAVLEKHNIELKVEQELVNWE